MLLDQYLAKKNMKVIDFLNFSKMPRQTFYNVLNGKSIRWQTAIWVEELTNGEVTASELLARLNSNHNKKHDKKKNDA